MRISKKVQALSPSVIVEIMMMAKDLQSKGVDLVSFAVGEPDFETPAFIKESCRRAIEQGYTRYSHGLGILELRKVIAQKLKTENGLEYSPETQIAVTIGAKNALYQALAGLINEGDEVLLPAPYWVTYPEMIKLTGADLRVIMTSPKNGYKLTPQELRKHITDKSKVLILNYPNNPGGFCYTRKELEALGDVIAGTNVIVISDEIYEKIIFEDTEFHSFAAVVPRLIDQTLTVNGCSKTYAMTGWRVGYVAGPLDIIEAVGKIQSQISLGTPTFCQVAAEDAILQGQADIERMRVEYESRAEYVYERLCNIPGLVCNKPDGTFYVFPRVAELYPKLGVKNSVDFCKILLEKAKVACVPGVSFGFDDNIRISYATSMEKIKIGMDRLNALLTHS